MNIVEKEINKDLFVIDQYQKSKKSNKKILLIFAVLILIIFGVGAGYLVQRDKDFSVSTEAREQGGGPGGEVTTSFPFQEMTIPYLREKVYDSELSKLEQVSTNANYTTYLTSYESDGFEINGLLLRPTGTEPDGGWPGIVFVHGYIPPTLYKTLGPQYDDYIDYLARQGFVVFKIDLRGHDSSEGEPGGGYFGSDYIVDTLNAYSALQNTDFVNPEAIGLWGHSMAGNVLMRSFATKPDIPAVVIWAGAVYSYTDREKYGINDNSYRPPAPSDSERQSRRQELFEKYGDGTSQNDFWKMVAPTNYLSDLKGAIQIHHAVNDTVVNIGYSRDLNALLDETSVEHALIEHQSGGHNIEGAAFVTAMQETAEFYKEHLR